MNTTYNQTRVDSPEQPGGAIEDLRHILEAKYGREVSYEEAEEVGDSLINFYEVLAASDQPEALSEA
jgi:hypothetical protein